MGKQDLRNKLGGIVAQLATPVKAISREQAINEIEKIIAQETKKAEVRGRLKQLSKDRRHQNDVWGDNRDKGYYKSEKIMLQSRLQSGGEENK